MTESITTLMDEESERAVDFSDLDGGEKRQRKAEVERMVVIPDATRHAEPTGIYTVFTTSSTGLEDGYEVTLGRGVQACGCPDMQFNSPAGGCKHIRRVALGINDGRLPAPDAESVIPFAHRLREQATRLDRKIARLDGRIQGVGETMHEAKDRGADEFAEAMQSRLGDLNAEKGELMDLREKL